VELAPANRDGRPPRRAQGAGRDAGSRWACKASNDGLLDALGRQHTTSQIYRAYELIRAQGFASVNIDHDVCAARARARNNGAPTSPRHCGSRPNHLSTYCLTFEEDTALWIKLSQGKVKLDADKEAAFYVKTWEFSSSRPATPSMRCRTSRAQVTNASTISTPWNMHEWGGARGRRARRSTPGWRAANSSDLALWHADLGRRPPRDPRTGWR